MTATPKPTPRSEARADATTSPQPFDRLAAQAAGDGAPLDPGAESTAWVGRTHWTHFAGSISLAILAVVLATLVCFQLRSRDGILVIWFLLVTASIVIAGARILWRVLSCRYRLTNQRLFIERGIFAQTIDQTELIRVDDVRIRKTFTNRLLGLGSIKILSTDVTDHAVVLEGVRAAETVAEHIRGHMRTLRRNSLFVEKL